MKNRENVDLESLEKYFDYYETFFSKNSGKHPLVERKYYEIKKEFNYLCCSENIKDPLIFVSNLLMLDAKLQILYELSQNNTYLNLTDNDVIRICETDSKYYYLESFEKKISDSPPFSLLFLNFFFDK